jgi:hypothetical protein
MRSYEYRGYDNENEELEQAGANKFHNVHRVIWKPAAKKIYYPDSENRSDGVPDADRSVSPGELRGRAGKRARL